MNETDATQQPITESRTFELFRIERREYTDQHGFARREPFKVDTRMVTAQDDGTAKDEQGNVYSQSTSNRSKWYTDMFATWRESYSGHLGEVS